MRRLLSLACLALGLLVCSAATAFAEEWNSDFHSDITIKADASMVVTETIAVHCENEQIKHGIYRDFPTVYHDLSGHRYVVGFRVLKVTRYGAAEPYHQERLANGIRTYIGDKDVYLTPGDYTYKVSYQTDHQLGSFKDHDELYWDVTGNGWDFSIREASATVTLPRGIAAQRIRVEGYTGPRGSKDRYLKASVNSAGQATFVTTLPLDPQEGLTIVVSFPKGFVHPPRTTTIAELMRTSNSLVVAVVALLVLLAFFLFAWATVGRDPQRGVVSLESAPPEGLSPAAVRYVREMGYDNKAFAAAVVSLAVQGRLRIADDDGKYTLTLVDAADRSSATGPEPAPEEQLILTQLLSPHSPVKLEQNQYVIIQPVARGVQRSLDLAYGAGKLFSTNGGYLALGCLLAVLLAVGLAYCTQLPDAVEPFALPGNLRLDLAEQAGVWVAFLFSLPFAIAGFCLFFGLALPVWFKVFSRGVPGRRAYIFTALCLTPFSLVFAAAGSFMLLSLSAAFLCYLVSAIALIFLFAPLLKAYTPEGRRLMDGIEGLRRYLVEAEPGPTQPWSSPNRTPEVFEKYLPYAMALDVEKEWAARFSDVLARASSDGDTAYRPSWHTGRNYAALGAAGLAASLGGGFSDAISSSSTPPGSSSGSGGGGSSGGGGGGGGGGGW